MMSELHPKYRAAATAIEDFAFGAFRMLCVEQHDGRTLEDVFTIQQVERLRREIHEGTLRWIRTYSDAAAASRHAEKKRIARIPKRKRR